MDRKGRIRRGDPTLGERREGGRSWGERDVSRDKRREMERI